MSWTGGKMQMLAVSVLCALPAVVMAAPTNSLFDPKDYPVALYNLYMTNGSIAIDTRDGVSLPVMTAVAGAVTNTYTGRIVTNQSGKVVMGMFNFGKVVIGSSVSCTVTGNLGLVIGSQRRFDFGATLSVSGFPGAGTNGGIGGAGAEAGAPASAFTSAPPTAARGRGGPGINGFTTISGVGFGAGPGGSTIYGCGGGYGGRGNSGDAPVLRGTNYGDAALNDLYGGSGAGGGRGSGSVAGGGGGGGGSVEFISLNQMTFSGTVNASGGGSGIANFVAGGAGSGGGILLAAPSVVVSNGTLNAQGGNALDWAGAGGGGRIAVYGTLSGNLTTNVAGGATDHNRGGTAGTYTNVQYFPFKPVGGGTVVSIL